jgi:hypothetical protein
MNRLIKLIVAVLLSTLIFAAQAQNQSRKPEIQARITQAKLNEIKRALALSDAKMNELTPVYKRYEAEKSQISFPGQGKMLRSNPDSLSTEEADKLITAHLDNAVKMSSIRRKYYSEFKNVLTPQQVMRLYKSEAQLNKKVMQELRRRKRNREGQN